MVPLFFSFQLFLHVPIEIESETIKTGFSPSQEQGVLGRWLGWSMLLASSPGAPIVSAQASMLPHQSFEPYPTATSKKTPQ